MGNTETKEPCDCLNCRVAAVLTEKASMKDVAGLVAMIVDGYFDTPEEVTKCFIMAHQTVMINHISRKILGDGVEIQSVTVVDLGGEAAESDDKPTHH